jgi:hypothetical protein
VLQPRIFGLAAPFVFVALAMVQANQKLPPPDEAAQAKAEKQIKEVFREDYAKSKPADLKALFAKLLKQARETTDDPAARYVLFREAADLAAHAGDAVTAIQVVGEWARSFAIDERLMKSEKLLAANKAAGSNTDLKNVADAALTLVEEAVTADDYATALRLIVAAHDAAKHGSHSALAKQIEARSIDLKAMEREYPAVKEALETLATKPDDADACRLAGKFLCYWKGDWEKGLPFLATGFIDDVGTLARKDRANPTEPGKMVEVADGWWTVSEGLQGGARLNVLSRALAWYQSALPKLSGLTKAKVEKRLDELEVLGVKPRLTILQAVYGADEKWLNVAEQLRTKVKGAKLVLGDCGELVVGDPVFGKHKSLVVLYQHEGWHFHISSSEDSLQLPGSGDFPNKSFKSWPGTQKLTILHAIYGSYHSWLDVTEKTRNLVRNDRLAMTNGNLMVGDPAPGKFKTLIVLYSNGDKLHVKTKGDSEKNHLLVLP